MEMLDDVGLLSRVLAREFMDLGTRLFPRIATNEVLSETKGFVEFLGAIAMRERGEETPLVFAGKSISAGFVLVAKPEVFHTYGARPYLRWIMTLIR
jgi:hypothetical protein